MSLRRLLRPRSVAFVGGAIAAAARDECEAAGFDGPVYAVHPRGELGGRPAYRGVAELPEAPDAAFVAVNAAATVEVVRELAAIGAGGAACYAAGFSEAGTEDGAAREDALRDAADTMRCSARTATARSTSSAEAASGRCRGRTNGGSVASPPSSRAATSAST